MEQQEKLKKKQNKETEPAIHTPFTSRTRQTLTDLPNILEVCLRVTSVVP